MAIRNVQTNFGALAGVPGTNPDITVFRGVPYAKPPVGGLRFAEPQDPAGWQGEKLCDTWPAPCIQYNRKTSAAGGAHALKKREYIPDGSEDCLYLNIWTPAEKADEKLPVMLWFYGGGFNSGWNSSSRFRGEKLVEKGVVLVAAGFRSGPLGFITHPALTARSRYGASGNYGLLDQVKAMEWVRDNISAFGGDPERITIFGQSSGGIACKFHLCSPLSQGLFQRTIIMSGGGINGADPIRTSEELGSVTEQCMERLGWTFADLMTRDGHEVSEKMGDMGDVLTGKKELFVFQPSLDGRFLTEHPEYAIARGDYNTDIDIICGTVKGDSWMFSRRVRHLLADRPDVLHAFAYSPGIAWARNQAESGDRPIRTYFFERDQGEGHTPHGCELSYVFGTLEAEPDHASADYDWTLSEAMMCYWSNFARTGDPNGDGLPAWPYYTANAPLTMHFDDASFGAEDIVEGPAGEEVIAFVRTHPGMLETLDGFPA